MQWQPVLVECPVAAAAAVASTEVTCRWSQPASRPTGHHQRNIANLAAHTDLNFLSVLQFAVESLGVENIIVCGHYGCGGVNAAMRRESLGLIDNWLRSIKDLYAQHAEELDRIADETLRLDRLCELNVHQQVANICQTTIVQDAWSRGQEIAVHGWIYGMHDGLLRDLDVCVTGPDGIEPIYRVP